MKGLIELLSEANESMNSFYIVRACVYVEGPLKFDCNHLYDQLAS